MCIFLKELSLNCGIIISLRASKKLSQWPHWQAKDLCVAWDCQFISGCLFGPAKYILATRDCPYLVVAYGYYLIECLDWKGHIGPSLSWGVVKHSTFTTAIISSSLSKTINLFCSDFKVEKKKIYIRNPMVIWTKGHTKVFCI